MQIVPCVLLDPHLHHNEYAMNTTYSLHTPTSHYFYYPLCSMFTSVLVWRFLISFTKASFSPLPKMHRLVFIFSNSPGSQSFHISLNIVSLTWILSLYNVVWQKSSTPFLLRTRIFSFRTSLVPSQGQLLTPSYISLERTRMFSSVFSWFITWHLCAHFVYDVLQIEYLHVFKQ